MEFESECEKQLFIELFRSANAVCNNFQKKGSILEGVIPSEILLRLISVYEKIIQNPWYDWKVNYGTLDNIEAYLNIEKHKLSYKVLGFEEISCFNIDICSCNLQKNQKVVGLLIKVAALLKSVIEREYQRIQSKEWGSKYMNVRMNVYPKSFDDYKNKVIDFRRSKFESDDYSLNDSDLEELYEYHKKLIAENDRNKKYDLNYMDGFFIARYDKVGLYVDHIIGNNENLKWEVNFFNKFSKFEDYQKYLEEVEKDSYSNDWQEEQYENYYNSLNDEMSRDGNSSFYEGMSQEELGID